MNILIVARAGSVRSSLQALLWSVPQVTDVALAEDVVSALNWIADNRPPLVMLDLYLLGDEIWSALRQIHRLSPGTRRVVLADDVVQQAEVEAPAADAVLLKGTLPGDLVSTVERLLQSNR